MATKTTKKKPAKKSTTKKRGVFFGYATKTDGATIKLERARNCVFWDASVRGFLGLAATGPNNLCRIGPPADIELRAITCVANVSTDAVKAWESQPWA